MRSTSIGSWHRCGKGDLRRASARSTKEPGQRRADCCLSASPAQLQRRISPAGRPHRRHRRATANRRAAQEKSCPATHLADSHKTSLLKADKQYMRRILVETSVKTYGITRILQCCHGDDQLSTRACSSKHVIDDHGHPDRLEHYGGHVGAAARQLTAKRHHLGAMRGEMQVESVDSTRSNLDQDPARAGHRIGRRRRGRP